jgi:glycine cleavage system H protein
MSNPTDRKYAATHEWVRSEPDGTVTLGITHTAQEMLGDIVFVGDAKVGSRLAAGETAAVVESVKAASDIYAPVAAEVIAFNAELEAEPQRLNEKPFDTWILRLRPSNPADLGGLLDAAGYEAAVGAA